MTQEEVPAGLLLALHLQWVVRHNNLGTMKRTVRLYDLDEGNHEAIAYITAEEDILDLLITEEEYEDLGVEEITMVNVNSAEELADLLARKPIDEEETTG